MKTSEHKSPEPDKAALLQLIGGDEPVDKKSQEKLGRAVEALKRDPEYLSLHLKGKFISEIYHAMQAQGINANQLAQRWGKSRQYVSKLLKEDRRVNFTLDTLVEVMLILGRRVELSFVEMEPLGRQVGETGKASRKPARKAVHKRKSGVRSAARRTVNA
jgi:predicted XRE-type DNA-binding protein